MLSVFHMSTQAWSRRRAPAGMKMTVDIPAHDTHTGRARLLPPRTGRLTAPSAAIAQSGTVRGETGVTHFLKASVINVWLKVICGDMVCVGQKEC